MQQFQTYPLSPSYPLKSPISVIRKDGSLIVIDDKQSLSRFTSNDSGISFGDSDNESTFSDDCELDIDLTLNEPRAITITNDAHMASVIRDDDKKFFCEDTTWAWHGEFGRLIMATAMTYNVDYRLMLYDAHSSCSRAQNAQYSMVRLDNAKAQFKCERCGHCWTSMRARCSFHISKPNEGSIVLLKLYTQQCQYCYSTVYPLWYFDEICRVMKNLAFTIFEHFFPKSFESVHWDMTHDGVKPIRRLLQRNGHMRAQHNPLLCEACQLGLCY